jgi:TFIIF-interacting CTD phosphatase-like protein
MHRERANKVFVKRYSRLLTRFIKFFTMARLPLHWSRAEGHRLQRKLCQANRHLHSVIIVKESQVMYDSCSQIMSYIFNMLIYVGMILLDNLL